MPDLSIEHYWMCQDLDYYEERMKSSCGRTEYNVTYHRGAWDCTCQGFRFRRTCKHIEAAKKKQCDWHQYIHGGEPKMVDNDTEKVPVCPKCGRPCISVKVAV